MKRFVKVSLMLASAAVLLSSCNCYKKMAKNADDVNITCTPTVLSLKGNTVSADITVTYPAAYFNKKAVLKVTPVLVFEGGEITGTPKYVQGEKVKDNYTVIAKKQGGSYTQTVTFPYDSRADLCTMELRVEGKCAKGKHSEFTPIAAIPVAQGISTIQKLADNAAGLAIMPDNFKRVTTISQGAEIMYLINRANVRKGELTKEQIKMFEDFVKEYSNKDRATLGNIYAKGYASPDGPLAFNDKLSKERSQTGQKAISEKLKDVKNAKYDIAAYGEDWEGFKELVSKSNIKDKDLILQVLSMYSSSTQREDEIKNMSSVFNELKKDILPQLRRSVIVNTIDLEGKTDAEMMALVEAGKLDQLNLNELLFVAESIAQDNATKNIVLAYAAEKYNDARAYNNLGIVLTEEGRTADALKCFQKAAQLGEASEALNTNLALANLANGNMAEAQKYAKGADAKAKSLVNAAQGNYNDAAKQLDGMNAAIANTMNKDYAAAKRAIAKDMSAEADYLRAVIASEEGDMRTAEAQLKSAVKKDEKMAKKAMKDIHFKKLFEEGLKF